MRDRIRAMTAISRIRDHELQGKSADLMRMEGDLTRIREVRSTLRQARIEGATVDDPNAMAYAAGFIRRINLEEKRASSAEKRMEGMIAEKRAEVMDAWRGMRSIERLRESAVSQLNRAIETVENAGNDERNIIAYGRAMRGA